MVIKLKKIGLAGVGAVAISAFTISDAKAMTKDLDLMFVIDESGSMRNEFTDLGANIETFFNALSSDSRTGSVAGGLVRYLFSPTLVQPITTVVSSLKSAIDGVSTGGGTENGIGAIDSVLPGGSLFAGAGWRNNTVKSVVLITDEDADDASGPTSYTDLATRITGAGYLNNIIRECRPNSSGACRDNAADYDPAAVPVGAVFNLEDFNTDPSGFLAGFAEAKLGELETAPITPGAVVPLPAALPLVLTGLGAIGGLGALRRSKGRRKDA